MKVLYFTATGNSLYVAKRLGGECYSIPKLIKEGKFEFKDEKIGIIFPTYYIGVPKIVEEFLSKANLKGKYIFGIATYGGFSGAVSRHLFEIGKRNGIEFSYINEIIMVDNNLVMLDVKKQIEKESGKKIEENLGKIIKDVEEGKKYIKKHTIIMNGMRLILEKLYNNEFEKNFYVDNNCNGCKTCEKVCPVDNIKVENTPIFNNNCQQCMACIHNCPNRAISVKKEKNKTRFINQNITLKEIIDSNN